MLLYVIYLARSNNMKIIYFLFFIFYSANSFSHDCILKGTSAEEITIYNSCKANQSVQKPLHSDLNKSLYKVQIKKLAKENQNLRNQLLDVKVRLNTLMSIINSYIN